MPAPAAAVTIATLPSSKPTVDLLSRKAREVRLTSLQEGVLPFVGFPARVEVGRDLLHPVSPRRFAQRLIHRAEGRLQDLQTAWALLHELRTPAVDLPVELVVAHRGID